MNTLIYPAIATAYYPSNDPIEGGFLDRFDRKLVTVNDVIEHKSEVADVAMDSDAFSKDTILRIPEIENYFNRIILFRVCDTGSAFDKPGINRDRIDICVRTLEDSLKEIYNRQVTLMWFKELNLKSRPPFPA